LALAEHLEKLRPEVIDSRSAYLDEMHGGDVMGEPARILNRFTGRLL
jgi:hypothetical protein